MYCFDAPEPERLIRFVYTDDIQLDYGGILGRAAGDVETITVNEWAQRLKKIHEPYESTQHVIQ